MSETSTLVHYVSGMTVSSATGTLYCLWMNVTDSRINYIEAKLPKASAIGLHIDLMNCIEKARGGFYKVVSQQIRIYSIY